MPRKYDFDTVIDRSNTSCEKWDGVEERFGVPDLHAMWVADMDFKAPPEVIEILRQRVDHGIFGYTGRFDPYYGSIIDWMKRRHGWEVRKEWLCHSPGVVPALSMALLAFSQPGDKVIIQPPVYYPFFDVIGGRGRTILENPLIFENGRFSMDLDDLEKRSTLLSRLYSSAAPIIPLAGSGPGMNWKDSAEYVSRMISSSYLTRSILTSSSKDPDMYPLPASLTNLPAEALHVFLQARPLT